MRNREEPAFRLKGDRRRVRWQQSSSWPAGVGGGRARLSPGRHNRNQTARSVWSAWSLLPLSNRATHPTAGASSTHSIRFARHDRPCHPSVQFAPYPPKIWAKNKIFAYIIQRAAASPRSQLPKFLASVTEKHIALRTVHMVRAVLKKHQ